MNHFLPLSVFGLAVLIQVGAGGRSHAADDVRAADVSFRRDVAPVLATSCSTRSCHGGWRPPVLDAHGDPAKMRAALIGIAADERPIESYVSPGHPEQSYLVQKIESRMGTAECTDHDCGEAMPLDNPLLPPATRQMIRAWIEQGAKDN